MRIEPNAVTVPFLLLLALLFAGPAWAQTEEDRLEGYFAAKQSAYRYYRSAWFYLRTGNVALSSLELSSFAEGWDEIRARFGDDPPGPFAEDPLWRESLDRIAELTAAGQAALEANDAEAAKAALADVPRIMADTRARSDVVTFSDSVEDVSDALDGLWRYRDGEIDFAEEATRADLGAGAARLRGAMGRLRDDAPDEVAFDDRFLRLVDNGDAAIDRLEQAIDAQDQADVVNALRELRSFERLLWLNFG